MKTLGLIGGLSPESTVTYYKWINAGVPGHASAPMLISSVNFADFVDRFGDWSRQAEILCAEARRLEAAGADILVLATNTLHRLAPEIKTSVSIPFLSIVDAVGDAVEKAGISRVGLLGTRYTMELNFYNDQINPEVIVPDEKDSEQVSAIIYEELCQGVVRESSREVYKGVISRLAANGAEAVILGCTEINLLISEQDSSLPVFDSTRIHVDRILSEILDMNSD